MTWDDAKSSANLRKHRVSFEEASQLFKSGSQVLEVFDEAHSDFEDRFVAIGPIRRSIVVVVWTEREEDTIRIISARMARRRESQLYAECLEKLR